MMIFLRRYWRWIAGAIVALVALSFAFCRPQPKPVPPKEQKSIDSLTITKPTFDSTQHAVTEGAKKVITKIVHDSAAAVAARKIADDYRRIADSALAVARASHDTTSAAFVAAENATKEANQLRAMNDTLRSDLSIAKDTIAALVHQIKRDSTRQNATDDLNARLAADIRRGDGCRLAWLLACPSRKATAVVSATIGFGAGYVAHR